jgi:hypothetical protein
MDFEHMNTTPPAEIAADTTNTGAPVIDPASAPVVDPTPVADPVPAADKPDEFIESINKRYGT